MVVVAGGYGSWMVMVADGSLMMVYGDFLMVNDGLLMENEWLCNVGSQWLIMGF